MFNLPKFGVGPCLERLARLLNSLGIDQDRLSARSVVICGSNGKGSTAAFCESIGRHLGLKTGLFTSPHLFDFSERFQINRQPIPKGLLKQYIERITTAIFADRQSADFGGFEAQFALAVLYFQEQQCDLLVLEAGIGGRFDPVRLVQSRYVAVTSLDLEHTEILGKTLLEIGLDKSDACAPGGTVFYGANCSDLAGTLQVYNQSKNRLTSFMEPLPLVSEALNLAGQFQRENAQVACVLMRVWWLEIGQPKNNHARLSTDFDAIAQLALVKTQWPGRLQPISAKPLVVVDVGHTPDGVRKALDGLEATWPARSWTCVVGVSVDKDSLAILQRLVERFDRFVVTRALHKGKPSEQIAQEIETVAQQIGKKVQVAMTHSTRSACDLVRLKPSEPVYVAGGLFVAVEFWQEWRGESASELQFF